MFLSSRNGLRPNGRLNASSRPQVYRPMLEVLEDRITPSSLATIPPPTNNMSVNTTQAVVAQSTAQAASQITFAFTPNRRIYTAGSPSVTIAITLTDSTTGKPITTGEVELRVADSHGNTVGSPIVAPVSTTGQISAAYALPPNTPAGAYTVTAIYHNLNDPADGAQGSAILTLVLPPAPAQHIPGSPVPVSPPAQVQVQAQGQSPPVLSLQQAALTLYISGIERAFDTILHRPLDGVQASINAALPYAGPWGSLFELAGEMAVFNALQNQTT